MNRFRRCGAVVSRDDSQVLPGEKIPDLRQEARERHTLLIIGVACRDCPQPKAEATQPGIPAD
jgi:hypothetical protein